MESYINNSFAYDENRKRDTRKGQFFYNMDFEFTDYLTAKNTAFGENPVIGNLIMGSIKMPITLSEVNRLIDTLNDVKLTYDQRRKLKMFDLPK